METKKYLFQPEKKVLKQGFFMEDENKKVVYEAKMLKQGIFGASKFEFINHISNKTEEHKIGHTVTIEQTGAFEFFSTKSYFKYDGKKIWDYLHDEGVRIDSNFSDKKIGMSYKVSFKGEEIATIATSTLKGKSIVTTNFFLDVITSEDNLDLAFLVAFAIAKTEQTFHD